jgi:thioredoxin-dependent peroxiredoxin
MDVSATRRAAKVVGSARDVDLDQSRRRTRQMVRRRESTTKAMSKVVGAKVPIVSGNATRSANDPKEMVGKAAPEFILPDQDGNPVSLKDLRQRGSVVLYFYPKDMTPGCTNEACSFRDNLDSVRAAGAHVVGISADSPASHRKFIAKYELTFPLLSDSGNEISKAYGVYKRKSLYGREFMGIERTTFIISRDGRIRCVFPRVKVNGHSDEVLAALRQSD